MYSGYTQRVSFIHAKLEETIKYNRYSECFWIGEAKVHVKASL